jgi:hypothetical protein
MRSLRRLVLPFLIATGAALALAQPATAVSISTNAQPTWQTVGALDAQGRNPDGRVEAILYGRKASARRVFIGGDFTAMQPPAAAGGNQVTRLRLASLKVKRGSLVNAWRVPVRSDAGDARVSSLALSPNGKVLYVGGRFDRVGRRARTNVAAVNAETGRVLRWHPDVSRGVHAIAVARTGVVYIGGTFSSVDGASRQHLAAVRASNGALVPGWTPTVTQIAGTCPPRCAVDVHALELSADGSALYVGGSFARVNGANRNSAAAVSTSTGHLLGWNPDVFGTQAGSLNIVYDLQRIGKRIVVCGDFEQIRSGGSAFVSPNVAAVDRRRGNTKPRFNLATDGSVNACAYHGKAKLLFLGGHFDHAGRRGSVVGGSAPTRHHIAAAAGRTGSLYAWSPAANSTTGVFAVAVRKTRVAFGGDFTTINGNPQIGFAQFRVAS